MHGTRRTDLIALAASLLLIADLFLGWRRTDVDVGGAVEIRATETGWVGWGVLAGVLALVLVGLLLVRLRGRGEHALATLAVGLALPLAALLAAVTGDASVDMPGVGAQVDILLWPAWAGIALAMVAAVAGLSGQIRPARVAPTARNS